MDRKEEFLKPGERLDDLQNGYWMIQNPSLFCYGIDAVLLASYAKVKRGERAMDFCTGSGIVPILLKAKTNGEHFSGLEIQEYSAEMAQRSVRYNHLENDVEIFQGDVKTASQQFGKEVFDVVTCNPPYMTASPLITATPFAASTCAKKAAWLFPYAVHIRAPTIAAVFCSSAGSAPRTKRRDGMSANGISRSG